MSSRTGALVSAAITLLIFAVIPLMAPRYLPPSYMETLAQTGIDIPSFVNQLAIMGVAVAALTLVKGFVAPVSPLYLLAALASSGLTFAFTVVTLSFGRLEELGNLGLTTMRMEVQGSVNAITLDFRFLVQLTALTVALKMVEAVFKYIEARKEANALQISPAPSGVADI
ncbi:MAG: hypothetical protein V3S09_06740 [Candidatus Bathyarchaeia archaeon]